MSADTPFQPPINRQNHSLPPIQQAMRFFPCTLVLLVMCVGLFLLQVLTGVNPSQPTTEALLTWGANFLPFSLGNQPWRLVSSLFLHIGLLHLMFNMFALYYFGQVAERMVGSLNFLLLFILAGVGGNLLNNFLGMMDVIQGMMPVVSAGASGGIMGIGMMLLVVALRKKPINGMMLSVKSLIWVMAINLGYGFLVGGIDNAGHVGGAVTGAVLAILYSLGQSKYGTLHARQPLILAGYVVIIVGFLVIYWYLHSQFLALTMIKSGIVSAI
ncbi:MULTISPECIES: rhomboid family intramembrane serine protease [unclassified Moraxella]|uniref:rhomboid family intramembrane serine protease n=1 Tax=unclassified Moraxella TaxID=2685852 RepID=UPI003AF7BEDF